MNRQLNAETHPPTGKIGALDWVYAILAFIIIGGAGSISDYICVLAGV
tara:strand:- start:459 stop:602 length:144 start_codon:yes stop_codon:yes gene_type:complete